MSTPHRPPTALVVDADPTDRTRIAGLLNGSGPAIVRISCGSLAERVRVAHESRS